MSPLDADLHVAGVQDSNALPKEDKIGATDLAAGPKSPSVVQVWKCWGGLAARAAKTSVMSEHPSVMSACWYLDFNVDWSTFMAFDTLAVAKGMVSIQDSKRSAKALREGGGQGQPNYQIIAGLEQQRLRHMDYFVGGQ